MTQQGRLYRLASILVLLAVAMWPRGGGVEVGAAATDWPQYRHDIQRSGRTSAALPQGDRLHLQWAYSFGERVEIEVEPIVAGGKVFVGAMNGVFTALDAATGSVAWRFEGAGPIAHSAAYYNGQVFFGSLDGAVYALDAATGALAWRFTTEGPVFAAPAVANNLVYIGSTAGRFYALDLNTGAPRWRYPAGPTPLAAPFTGAAALAPDGSRVYVGSEDLYARAFDAAGGALIWERRLPGVGMRGTHPVVADDGAVVIFQTTKPGVQSYVPTEDYPDASPGNDPVATWNSYYQNHPERRAIFFLRSDTGAELWDASNQRYVPLPLPYWGLLAPVLDSRGDAWFPSPGGASGDGFGDYELDHDSRLMRVDLNTGTATQVAVRGQFQHRPDENGRATMAGDAYLTAISEDVGVYRPSNNSRAALFGNGFGSHMDPIGPPPSPHIWRYGGTIAMGGVAGASPPVVANGMVYYISYGWLFALGPTDQGKDPTGTAPLAFTARDERAHLLTYPRSDVASVAELRAELNTRVADLIVAGDLPPFARFEQAGGPMQEEISNFQLFGTPGERIWIISQALPYLSPALQNEARSYMRGLAQTHLFNPDAYQYRRDCLIYNQQGVKSGSACDASAITASWWADNELLIGERLYAMAAYSEATGDWSLVDANWPLISSLFNRFTSAYDPALGFAAFEKWRVGKLDLPRQIGAAAGMLRMAEQRGDTTMAAQARSLLDNLLTTRVRLAHFVRDQYDSGATQPLPMRIGPDGVPHIDDVFEYNNPGELIPLAGDRTRDTDTRQVTWYDGDQVKTHSTPGFMHYQALVGYGPLYPELAAHLRANLLEETRQYVQSFEVNAPWWWMSDLAHHTTAGGEHLWHSAALAHDLFQTKAWVLQEDWGALRQQLPLPMSSHARYDLYRLHNLATLLALSEPDLTSSTLSAQPGAPQQGQRTTLTFELSNLGGPVEEELTLTFTLPPELAYVAGSARAPNGGFTVEEQTITWRGTPGDAAVLPIQVEALANDPQRRVVLAYARLDADAYGTIERTLQVFLNGDSASLPLLRR